MSGRRADWQGALEQWFEACRERPFAWGAHDCCTFAMGAVRAVTGAELLPEWRGRYASRAQAQRLIADGGGLAALVEARIGERVRVQLAQPGDVGLFRERRGAALCVEGGGQWFAPGREGLRVIEPAAVRMAWRCARA